MNKCERDSREKNARVIANSAEKETTERRTKEKVRNRTKETAHTSLSVITDITAFECAEKETIKKDRKTQRMQCRKRHSKKKDTQRKKTTPHRQSSKTKTK
jgi:hypothetical protein